MSVQASPTRHPRAENIPGELWERIAYYANAGDDAFLGPPVNVASLCLVCRSIYRDICFANNTGLYARLFCFKFDYQAPLRRLGRHLLTTQNLAQEFKKRIIALKRVRRRECNDQDLWTCYLMMLENDGKNERQLIEWAHLYGFLKRETCFRFEANLSSPSNWFRDTEGTSLLLWLWWMTFSRDDLLMENPHVRDSLVCHLLHNLVVASFRYPNVYGPESHFQVPLSADAAQSAWSSSPPTPVVHVSHYSTDFRLATPLLSLASLLVWTIRLEIIRGMSAFDQNTISTYPVDRETAIAHRIQGPTQMDVLKFHEMHIQVPDHCSADTFASFEDEIMSSECKTVPERCLPLSGSWRYDNDWYRTIACSDPLSITIHGNHPVYHLGAATGSWEGFVVQTSLDAHMQLVGEPNRTPSESTALFRHPLYFTLKEHYCLHPETPVPPGKHCLGDDDVLNAWLPQGLEILEHENNIEVFDPSTQKTARYHTFFPESLETTHYSQSKVPSRKSRAATAPSENRFSYRSKDLVNDILVTGKTSEEDGAAWGHYLFVGRVRLWDGFIVLLRTPRDPTRSDLGRWLFKGYIHNENLVGHWRDTSTPPKLVGYQGGFIARNVESRN
ncbi:hypothetical protein GYMLUDRAFT_75135 [Collybiopsis luxurians FD-317 M1]|uniref:F-box domain-containing protein n=1 Tax=Collybiopsis luxurians FD-317 M1 TaxID=944289 RepID=A0A0D0BS28_9AGAR|nr:hypothetical protein GYMLUDRAFT_75135 [Collybiopsis luxurians FD-317 M1]